MNWIERVAKILRDKVVLDVGGQFPVKGHIDMGAYALKADYVAKIGGLPVAKILRKTDSLATALDAGIYYCIMVPDAPTAGNGVCLVIGNNLKDGNRRTAQIYFSDTLTGSITYHRNIGYQIKSDADAASNFSPWVHDATSVDIDALNNKISALEAQISGGE